MPILDKSFRVFSIGFPDREKTGELAKASEKKLKDKIPEELLILLKEEGCFSFCDGLFFLTDPIQLTPITIDWKLNPESDFIFLRTAFGDLFYWNGNSVNVIHVNTAVRNALGSDIVDFMNFALPDNKYNEKTLFGKYIKKAKQDLGKLKPDECYTFVPTIPLGGKASASNLQIGKLKEYLAILAESHQQ